MSNPVPEPSPSQEQPPLDPLDPDVQKIVGKPAVYQASVEEVPENHGSPPTSPAQRPAINDSSSPPIIAPPITLRSNPADSLQSQPPPLPTPPERYYNDNPTVDVSPLQSPRGGRTGSAGSGYFPKVRDDEELKSPSFGNFGRSTAPQFPSPPADSWSTNQPPTVSPLPIGAPPPHLLSPNSLHSFPPPTMDQTDMNVPSYPQHPVATTTQSANTPVIPSIQPLTQSTIVHPNQPSLPNPHFIPPAITPQPISAAQFLADEDAIVKAQKHARWAISALNFEDVNTAVKELRGALESLGAR